MIQPFLTYRETINEKLGYFIVQKAFPHLHCQISEVPINKYVSAIPVSSYNLWICFAGTLRGNFIPSYNDFDKEILITMEVMASWFLDNRILTDEKKYKKWKV